MILAHASTKTRVMGEKRSIFSRDVVLLPAKWRVKPALWRAVLAR